MEDQVLRLAAFDCCLDSFGHPFDVGCDIGVPRQDRLAFRHDFERVQIVERQAVAGLAEVHDRVGKTERADTFERTTHGDHAGLDRTIS